MRSFAVLTLLALASAAVADTELVFDDGGMILIKDQKVLFGDDETGMLYPGSGNAMTVIHWDAQEYTIIDESFADSMSAQLDAAMAEMEAQLAQLPPEQQAMMREMLKSSMPAAAEKNAPVKRTFRKTGGKQQIAGYSCSNGEVLENGRPEYEVCIASIREIGMPRKDFDALQQAFEAMGSLFEKFAPDSEDMFDLELMEGVPLSSRDKDGSSQSRLVSASNKEIDSTRMAVPDHFRRKDPAEGF